VSTVSVFKSSLASALGTSGLGVDQWAGATRKSNHMLQISTRPKATVLYVKESNTTPPFWGLTKNQLARLRASSVRWFVILLDGSATRGYVLSAAQVESRIVDGTFELSGDGDHKVNKGDLAVSQHFGDLNTLLGLLGIVPLEGSGHSG